MKNNLEVVSSLLALQSNQSEDEHTREAMLESQNRVQSIGKFTRNSTRVRTWARLTYETILLTSATAYLIY